MKILVTPKKDAVDILGGQSSDESSGGSEGRHLDRDGSGVTTKFGISYFFRTGMRKKAEVRNSQP